MQENSTRKLQTLFEILPVGLSILNVERQILYSNPALNRVLELSDATFSQHTQRHYIRPDGSPLRLEEFPSMRAAVEQRAIMDQEIGIMREDGATIWVSVSAVPVDFSDWAVVVTTVNITQRKEVEAALLAQTETLRHERDLLNLVTETSPVGLTFVDGVGQLTFANTSAERILGLSRSEIAGLAYNAPEWRITDCDGGPFPEADLPFTRVKTTGQPVYDVRHAIVWPDGRRVILEINAAPVFDAHGHFDGIIASLEDITARVVEERQRQAQLEQELRALDGLSRPTTTPVTARAFGLGALREIAPEIFASFTQQYNEILDMALEQQIYRVAHPLSERLRALADRLGQLNAGPRDVVEIHSAALLHKSQGTPPAKATAYAEEGRLIVLELLGYLTAYYRNYALGIARTPQKPARLVNEPEGDPRHG